MNNYESLDSEHEDKSLSSEQLKICPESDLSECSSASTAKSYRPFATNDHIVLNLPY